MNNKIFAAAALAATLTLTGCNDDFLEKTPKTDLTEVNAFLEYDNFKAFMYPCYAMFTDTNIRTNFNTCVVNSQFYGDFYGGLVTSRDNSKNQYAYRTVTQTTTGNGWNFDYIRRMSYAMILQKGGSMIYWDEISSVLHSFEGPQQTRGYIPCNLTTGGTANYSGGANPERYDPMGVSGVTIGTGVDLGQTDADTLRGMGVPDAVIQLFVPYLGKRKAAAVLALHEHPLVISVEDADVLDAAMLKHHVNKISARYDRDAGEGAFAMLPWQAQAVIVSIQYQRGVNSPSKYPKTWAAFVRQNWKDAAYRLKTRRFWSGYQDRRYAEGRILEGLC